MSLDGNGNYTLPAGNPVVTNTVISSTVHNNTMTDIKNTLSNAMYKDGQSTPTANIKMGGFKLTGLAAATTAGDAVRYEQVYGTGVIPTASLADKAVAYAKIQDVTAGKLLGRDTSGNGVVQELPIAVDSSGNVGIGTSSPTEKLTVNGGVIAKGDAVLPAGSSGVTVGYDTPNLIGNIYSLTSGTAWRDLAIRANQTVFFGGGTERARIDSSGNLLPGGDNSQTFGNGSKRWSVIYAGTGTINTSDAREKTEIKKLNAAEIKAAKEIGQEIGIYQFLASVAEKCDKARHHIGMTVQRAIEIMEANGLNANAYGFICHDSWKDEFVEHPAIEAKDAVKDEEGNIVQEAVEAKEAWTEQIKVAGDMYGFRYDQLTLFIAAGFEARLSELEAK